MKNPKPSKYLEIEISEGDYKRIEIPTGLKVIVLESTFVKGVFDDVIPVLERSSARMTMGIIHTDRGFKGTIEYLKSNGVLYWGVRQGGGYLACGMFQMSGTDWRETHAAALHEARGQGLYKAVLRHLRVQLKKQLISDRRLSLANFIIWNSIGKPDHTSGRFRINPAIGKSISTRQYHAAMQVVRSIYAMEVA